VTVLEDQVTEKDFSKEECKVGRICGLLPFWGGKGAYSIVQMLKFAEFSDAVSCREDDSCGSSSRQTRTTV
jgi:hypothetical protein